MKTETKVDALLYGGLVLLCGGVGVRFGADVAVIIGGGFLLAFGVWLTRRL